MSIVKLNRFNTNDKYLNLLPGFFHKQQLFGEEAYLCVEAPCPMDKTFFIRFDLPFPNTHIYEMRLGSYEGVRFGFAVITKNRNVSVLGPTLLVAKPNIDTLWYLEHSNEDAHRLKCILKTTKMSFFRFEDEFLMITNNKTPTFCHKVEKN